MMYGPELSVVMKPYPGRDFRIGELIAGVERQVKERGEELTPQRRRAIRRGVHRVLAALEAAGALYVTRSQRRGSYALYRLTQAW